MSRNNNLIITNIFAVATLLVVVLAWKYNFIVSVALLTVATAMLSLERSKQEVKAFVYCAISGALCEYIAISFGAWTYANPNLFDIPIWLPLLWGIATVYSVRIYKYL